MQPIFVGEITRVRSGYEWYDSGAYTHHHIHPLKSRNPEHQRRLRAKFGAQSDHLIIDSYDPFKTNPAMFLELAQTDPDENAILAFANQYGELWDGDVWPDPPSLFEWREEIGDIKEAVSLWQAIEIRDEAELSNYLEWHKGKITWKSALARPFVKDGKKTAVIEFVGKLPPFRPGDLMGPATALLDYTLAGSSHWGMSMLPRRRDGLMEIQITTHTLLTVLWVQFASAIAGSKKFGHCEFCNKPFEQDVARTDKTFCSSHCRVKMHLRRKKRALQLHSEGKSLRDISKATGSKTSTIKEWLKPKGE